MGNIPEPPRYHLKYKWTCTFLSTVVRKEWGEGSSYPHCCPVLMEGWLLCRIGWGLGERRWMRYSRGPTIFNTSGVVFWGREMRRQKRGTWRKNVAGDVPSSGLWWQWFSVNREMRKSRREWQVIHEVKFFEGVRLSFRDYILPIFFFFCWTILLLMER